MNIFRGAIKHSLGILLDDIRSMLLVYEEDFDPSDKIALIDIQNKLLKLRDNYDR